MLETISYATLLPLLALGLLVYLAGFHLFLWFGRRRDRLHLWAAAWFVNSFALILVRHFQRAGSSPEEAVTLARLQLTAGFFFLLIGLGFVRAFGHSPPRRRENLAAAGLVGFLLTLLWLTEALMLSETYIRTDVLGAQYRVPYAGALVLPVALLVAGIIAWRFVVLSRASKVERRDRLTLLLGFSVGGVLAVNDLLLAAGVIQSLYLFDFGFVAVGLSVSGILVRRYNELCGNLEGAVAQRTRELEASNQELQAALADAEDAHRAVARLAAALAYAEDAVEITDAAGRVEYVNPGHERLTGYTQEEVVGRLSSLAPILRGGSSPGQEPSGPGLPRRERLTSLRRDGSEFEEEVVTIPVRDSQKTVVAFIVIRHDVTEEKRAEEALRRSESSFRALIEGSPDAIAVHRGGRIVFVNRTLLRLLGYQRADDLLGKPVLDFVHPEDRPQVATHFRASASQGRLALPLEERLLRVDGAAIVAEVHEVPVVFDGEPATVSIARDLTERKRLQERLSLADRMASVGTLAAGVAHEINNPLSFVLGNVDFVKDELVRVATELPPGRVDEVLEALGEIRAGAGRVRDIVRQLQVFARAGGEKRGPVDLRQVLETAIRLVGNEIRHRAQVVLAFAQIPLVDGDEARLGQLFVNLLLNAAQSIPEGDAARNEIRVSTRTHENGTAVVEIRDEGCGIPSSVLPKIFDPFFTTKPVGEGPGLGLSISHGIVSALGGRIEVESIVGSGTTVRVVLPPARVEARVGATIPEGSAAATRARVLVVDDEPMVARSLRRMLANHEVVVAVGGREARELLEGDPAFDVVFCDLMMPDLCGPDLFEQVRERHPALERRFVFMTGGAFTSRTASFLDQVPNQRIEKPFELSKIQQALAECLGTASGAAQ